ncbi:hypothetical protein RZS08_30470, partial [Arthrospira platensis SPKY1]|nr:hypothetical protein [Arthrospira platensis SPKY1]
ATFAGWVYSIEEKARANAQEIEHVRELADQTAKNLETVRIESQAARMEIVRQINGRFDQIDKKLDRVIEYLYQRDVGYTESGGCAGIEC